MSFNLESSHNDEINEVPEVDDSNEQLTESNESAEDFEDCSLNEAQDSNVDDNNQELVDEPQEAYDDCENNAVNQIEATSEGNADDDYDDFDDCGKYQSDTGKEHIGETEADQKLEEVTDKDELHPEIDEVVAEDEVPSDTEEATEEDEVPPETEETTEEDEVLPEAEESTKEDEVPPEAEESTKEDEVPPETEEATEEDEVPPETEEATEEDDIPPEAGEATEEDEAPPKIEEVTEEDEVPLETEEVIEEDEAPAETEEATEENELLPEIEKPSDEDDSAPNDTKEIPAESEDASDAVDSKLESDVGGDTNTDSTENLNNSGDGGDALCPVCGKNPCVCNNEKNGGGDSTKQVCPVCGKYPCVCKSLDAGEGNKKIEKLEDLSFDQINALSQTQEGREYLQHLHAEMAERVSAEQMGMTVEEYREHKQKIADYQNRKTEVPPHDPSDAEQTAMVAMNQARLTHEAFRREYYDGSDKQRLKDLNNILSSQIPELQKNESVVAGELNTVNDQIALMYSNGEHLTNREKYAVLCQKQAALEDCTNKLRGEIAVLSGDMYDCCQQTGEKYTHIGEKLRAEDQQAVLGNAREVLEKGVSSKEDVIGAFHTSEKIRYDVMPALDAQLKENNSVTKLVENDQKKYLAENNLTHEQAMSDPNGEYARNARYLDTLAAERASLEAKMLDADRLQTNLTQNLPVAGENYRVGVKDLKNGTLEVSYIWESGVKYTGLEGQYHDTSTKLYYRGTGRTETYTVGRDDSALYGHKYSVNYRGVGFEREDTFKKGDAKITNKLEGGLLNGNMEAGYLRDIDSGRMKASLDAAVSLAELKDTVTTTVNGKEYTIAAAEVAVAKGETGVKIDEHGVAVNRPEASPFSAKVTVGATDFEHGANPFAKPETIDEAFTKLHDGLEKKKEYEDVAKGEWGEDARGETVIRGETPKSLEDRMQDALKSDLVTVAELKQLQDEGNEKLRQLQNARQAVEQESQQKFAEVSTMPRGTDDFKKALQEYNALQDKKMILDEQLADLKNQQALLANKESSVHQGQQPDTEQKSLFGWFGRKQPEATETPTATFGNYEVDNHGFVKGENHESYIKDWEGYSADRYKTEMFDQAREQTISPSLVEGIRVSDNDIENPDIFWSQHEPGGTVESFEKIAANIPEVRDRLTAGEPLSDLMEDPRLGRCASIYFHPDSMPEVIKCGDYYEFQSNGRHRILAARNMGYDIPVKVTGERIIETPKAGSGPEATELSQENSIKDKFNSFFSGFFGGSAFSEGSLETVQQTPPEIVLGESDYGIEGTGETEQISNKLELDNLSKKKFSELNEGERQELVNITVDNLKKIYGDRIPEERYEKVRSSVRFLNGNEMVSNGYIKSNQVYSVLGSYSGRRDDITINMSADNDVKSILTTLDHESMHMVTAKLEGPYTTGLKINDVNIPGKNVGMNEGLTEMYSIRNVRELNPGYVSHSYTNNVRIMQKFESVIGADTIRNAYITNDFDTVKKAYEGRYGEGSFTEFCNKMDSMHNDYSDGKYAEGDKKRDQLLKMLDGDPDGTAGENIDVSNYRVHDGIALKETDEKRLSDKNVEVPTETPSITEVNENVARALGKVREESVQIDYFQREGRDALSEQERTTIERQLDRVFAECDYCIRINADALEGVCDKGEFYSQTVMGYEEMTKVTKNPGLRKEFSEHHYGQVMNEKFGYAGRFLNEMEKEEHEHLNKYGDIIVSFKKESVEGKMTYYLGDSLASYRYRAFEDPHLGIVGGEKGGTTLSGMVGNKYYQDILEPAEKGEMDPFAYVGDNSYLEIQYLGRLRLQDIESIGFLDENSYHNLAPEAKRLLAQNNIDVVIRQPDGSLRYMELGAQTEQNEQNQARKKKWFGLF